MNPNDRRSVDTLLNKLDELYPSDGKSFLDFEEPWHLLIATILSAQCTDARVNTVTPELFAKYPTLESLAAADRLELEACIKPTGFFHSKAEHILATARMLTDNFGSKLPQDMDSLTSLPGVGRKTANLVRGMVFGIPSIIVDTHVKRISYKLGLTDNRDPYKIEMDLRNVLPEEHWTRFNPQIISHGRQVCLARSPRCGQCGLSPLCRYFADNSAASGS